MGPNMNMGAAVAKQMKEAQDKIAENKAVKEQVVDFAGDGDSGPNKIRTRILNSFGERDLNMGIMRQLFRLLDDDGSGELSASEIRRGMVLMKFEDIEDPIALSKLLVDIDDDQTGTITEKEFLSFYAQHTRESLREHLHKYVCSTVFMRATYYGVSKDGKKEARSEVYETGGLLDGNLSSLKSWVSENCTPEGDNKLWLDMVGYEKDTFLRLSEIFGLDPSVLNDALVFQSPAISSVKGTGAAKVGAQIIVHKMSMSVETLKDRPADLPEPLQTLKRVFFRVADTSALPDYLSSKALANEDVSDAAISLEQTSIICVGDNVVITLRAPCPPPDKQVAEEEVKGQDSSSGGVNSSSPSKKRNKSTIYAHSSLPVSDHAFANDDSGIRRTYNNIHRILLDHQTNCDQHFLFDESAKSMSVHLLSSIVNDNFEVRNALQDWEEVLEADIRTTMSSKHVVHLDALDNVTKSYKRISGPLAESVNPMLESSAWYEDPEESTPPLTLAEKDEEGGEDGDETRSTFLLSFYVDYISEFSELAGDVNTVVANMNEKIDRVEKLGSLLVNLKSDMMNRTLYALTLITAYSMPMTFFTGLYGMNFTNIYELAGPEDPDYAGFGYAFFWYILSSTLVAIFFYMYKYGLFDALY